jgi:hypothetical protein
VQLFFVDPLTEQRILNTSNSASVNTGMANNVNTGMANNVNTGMANNSGTADEIHQSMIGGDFYLGKL